MFFACPNISAPTRVVLCVCPCSLTCPHSTSRWRLPSRWRMFGRCGASAHRCQSLQLFHIVRGGGDHTDRGTKGHRESVACDLESGTVPLQHIHGMVYDSGLRCRSHIRPLVEGAEGRRPYKATFRRWWKGPRVVGPYSKATLGRWWKGPRTVGPYIARLPRYSGTPNSEAPRYWRIIPE